MLKYVIPLILQSYMLNYYNTYLLHPGMYIIYSIISQYLYWTSIVKAVLKEVSKCDTCSHTK